MRIKRQRAARLGIIAANDDVTFAVQQKRSAGDKHAACTKRIGGGCHKRSVLQDGAAAIAVGAGERERATA
ncbi:hypothetical protein D3C87_1831950 [compost metagenome]